MDRWTIGDLFSLECLSGSQSERILNRKKFSYIWAKIQPGRSTKPWERTGLEKLSKYLAITKNSRTPATLVLGRDGLQSQSDSAQELGEQGQQDYRRRGRGRVNVMGGIREQDRKQVCFSSRGNADTFMSRFSSYMNLSRMSCSGNLAEQFQQTGPKVCLFWIMPAITSS